MLLICSTTYGGCGFIGTSKEFDGNGDSPLCPDCLNANASRGLTAQNRDNLTDENNQGLASELLMLASGDKEPVIKADCGCWYHAEEGIACPHDLTLARKHFLERRAV